ncbi:MAG: hypothetical protein PHV82_19350 [Victivallaceae bacterium]|nr:hypothetical protein [Victivallaceae bacterium]
MSTKNFKCRKCGGDSLDEVISGAIVAIRVTAVLECLSDDHCDCDYDQSQKEIGSGKISHYQCSSCGHILSEAELTALEENH